MTQKAPFSHPLRVADLAARKPTPFDLVPQPEEIVAIAAEVGADQLRKLRFAGTLLPRGRHDWVLEADLGATVVQPCVVTLQPVTTRIAETVRRTYQRDLPPPAEGEVEMPEDDTIEPLGPVIDLGAVLVEALALALPLYPRAPEAEFGEVTVAPPGVPPLRDAEIRPFAGLGGLRDRLAAGKPGDDAPPGPPATAIPLPEDGTDKTGGR